MRSLKQNWSIHDVEFLISQVGRDRLDSLVFISSGYLRARQTAEECRAALQNILSFERQAGLSESKSSGEEWDESNAVKAEDPTEWLERHGGYDFSPPIIVRPELRERSFGELDGTVLVNYNKVRAKPRARYCLCAKWHAGTSSCTGLVHGSFITHVLAATDCRNRSGPRTLRTASGQATE